MGLRGWRGVDVGLGRARQERRQTLAVNGPGATWLSWGIASGPKRGEGCCWPVVARGVPAIHVLATSKAAPGPSLPSGEGGTRQRDGWGVRRRRALGPTLQDALRATPHPTSAALRPPLGSSPRAGSPLKGGGTTSSAALTTCHSGRREAAGRNPGAGSGEVSPSGFRALAALAPERQLRSMRAASLLILSLDNKPKLCLCGGVLFRWGALARRRDVGQHCSCELACMGQLG
jgi:hypothetical protein